MDFSNLTGTDIAVVLTILIVAIVLIVFVFWGFKEKKKITEVTLKNMDFVVHPLLTFTGVRTATVENQTFQTPFGPVLVSADDKVIKNDKTSAVIVQVQQGPVTFTATTGGAVTLAVTNRTKNPLTVEGGEVVATLTADKTTHVPKEIFLGGIAPVTVPASASKNATLVVMGGNVVNNIDKAMFAVTLSNAMQAPPAQKEKQ